MAEPEKKVEDDEGLKMEGYVGRAMRFATTERVLAVPAASGGPVRPFGRERDHSLSGLFR